MRNHLILSVKLVSSRIECWVQVVQSQIKDYSKTLDLQKELVYALNVSCLGLILTGCLCNRTEPVLGHIVFHQFAFSQIANCVLPRSLIQSLYTFTVLCDSFVIVRDFSN